MHFKLAALSLFVAVAVAAPCDDHNHGDYPLPPVKVPTHPHKPSCKSSEFYYSPKNCCLPHGGPHKRPTPPTHKRCPPRDWYWKEDKSCCVPQHPLPSHPSKPSCDKNWYWNDKDACCYQHKPSPNPKPAPPSGPVKVPVPGNCKSDEFYFAPKKCCLPHGGPSHYPTPPPNKKCPPKEWYWKEEKECCVPKAPLPTNPPAPTCDSGFTWNKDTLCCDKAPAPIPTPGNCKSEEFYFEPKKCCLPKGGPSHFPSPPAHKKCPQKTWYWHDEKACCVPTAPLPPNPPAPTCDSGFAWNKDTLCCDPVTPAPVPNPGNCKSSEFYYAPKKCCLPHGGPSHFPAPPSGKKCPPKGWYWHSDKACCVPTAPLPSNPPTPTCDSHFTWNKDANCCEADAKPTPPPHHPRPGKDYPIKPIHYPKHKPTKTTTVTVTVTPSPSPVSQCNTSGSHCCNQVQSSHEEDATKLLDAYGIHVINTKTVSNATNVGINCSPLSGIGSTCTEQPVCCQNNNFSGGDGAIIIGCSPVNIYINGAGAGSLPI